MSDFEKISDEALIDAYRQVQKSLNHLYNARTTMKNADEPYGVVKGEERVEQGHDEIQEELRERGIDPNEVHVNE